MIPKNTQWRAVKGWLVVSLVGCLMVAAPFVLDIDMMAGGGAMMFLGFVIAPTGFIVSVMYSRRARALERMFEGKNILAHWKYDPETWRRYAAEDTEFRGSNAKMTLGIVAFFCILFGAGFWIYDPEAGFFVALVLLGVLVLCALAAWFSVALPARRNRQGTGEVFISREGMWLNGELHTWSIFGSKFGEASLVEGTPLQIEIVYSIPNKGGAQDWTVRAPVPPGEEKRAEEIVILLNSSLRREEFDDSDDDDDESVEKEEQ